MRMARLPKFLGIALDISDHKRAEAERWANVQMRRELRLLEDIFDLILAGYWDWDICGNQEYYSAGFKRMLGYDEHELSNQPETWQRLIFPEDLPEVRACLERHIRSHGQEPFYKEVRYHHKDGSNGVGDLLRPDHRVGRRRTAPADDWLPCQYQRSQSG